MEKLLNAFIANKNAKTALALRKYMAKHPMALCFATQAEYAILKEAEGM